LNKKQMRHLGIFAMLTLSMMSASAQVTTEVLHDFSACDARFFRRLGTSSASPTPAPMEHKGELAWFKVENRYDGKNNQTKFAVPIDVAGLKLTNYFDEIVDMQGVGKFLSWGFIAEGSLEEVASKIKPFVINSDRLRHGDADYHRTEVKIDQSAWIPRDLSSGKLPRASTTERVFVLEPGDEVDKTRITCSLQGAVTDEILKVERPDIDPTDYPAKSVPATSQDDALRPEVLKKIDTVAPMGGIWRPRFKKIVYEAEYQNLNKDKSFTVTDRLESRDGLVYRTEIYSPDFTVDRVQLAGLVQLRSKINDGRSLPYLATELNLVLPDKLDVGETLSVESLNQFFPQQQTARPVRDAYTCKMTAAISASSIFPSLSGKASLFFCQHPLSGDTNEMAFLEDLGVSVITKSQSSDYGNSVVHFSRFDVSQ
jgi:hypothetical protein